LYDGHLKTGKEQFLSVGTDLSETAPNIAAQKDLLAWMGYVYAR